MVDDTHPASSGGIERGREKRKIMCVLVLMCNCMQRVREERVCVCVIRRLERDRAECVCCKGIRER